MDRDNFTAPGKAGFIESTFWNFSGPACDDRLANAAFVKNPFASAISGGAAGRLDSFVVIMPPGGRAVIAGANDDERAAVQTLRDSPAISAFAKRLECGRLSTAFLHSAIVRQSAALLLPFSRSIVGWAGHRRCFKEFSIIDEARVFGVFQLRH